MNVVRMIYGAFQALAVLAVLYGIQHHILTAEGFTPLTKVQYFVAMGFFSIFVYAVHLVLSREPERGLDSNKEITEKEKKEREKNGKSYHVSESPVT